MKSHASWRKERFTLLELDAELMQQTLTTNTIGPLLVTQAFYPLLAKSAFARVINVSSRSGALSEMGTYSPAYSISKTALNAVTVQLANAFKHRGIAVNAACPGWVRTGMGGRSAPRRFVSSRARRRLFGSPPKRRKG